MSTTSDLNAGVSPAHSVWAPLRHPTFLWIWLAMLVSNIGGWVQDTTSAWVMATLTPSPLMVSLVSAEPLSPKTPQTAARLYPRQSFAGRVDNRKGRLIL